MAAVVSSSMPAVAVAASRVSETRSAKGGVQTVKAILNGPIRFGRKGGSSNASPSVAFASRGRSGSLGVTRRANSVVVRAAEGNGNGAAPTKPKRPEYIPNRIDDPNYVRIFDTTLRDGEQSPGATLTSKEKLDIAKQLKKLGVDIIEAGFPAASPDDHAAVSEIAKTVGNDVDEDGYVPVICGLSRANKKDIDASWSAVKHAKRPRIHTFIATSKIHMEYKLKKTEDQVVALAVEAVKYCRSLGCTDIEFSPEDAGRSEPEFLYRILGEVIKAGATTINIPDTVGITIPDEFGDLIAKIKANTPGADDVVISTHCQNDLGLSTGNSLAGAVNGARQIECTINGIGERAGNASLEEVAVALDLRGQDHMNGLFTGLSIEHISLTSRMVAEYTGMAVQPHKAIVGQNAFAHESGIHQDGMLKNKTTYEIIEPERVGIVRKDSAGIFLGKHSGRHALKTRLETLGVSLEGDELMEVFNRFKLVAEAKGGGVQDEDLFAILSDELYQPAELWHLEELQVVSGRTMPTATVKLVGPDGMPKVFCSVGTGPVDAAYKAVDMAMQIPVELLHFEMNSVTEGIDALAITKVIIRQANSELEVERKFQGSAADTDVIASSVKAYIHALNKLIDYVSKRRGMPSAFDGLGAEDTISTASQEFGAAHQTR
mmetsp:Transcript_26483/g.57559  ORF Transcript_26483/g.57559 Transcript_26483/m.57559 type:complete len:660 (-) Transcript_26483:335-2314(-)